MEGVEPPPSARPSVARTPWKQGPGEELVCSPRHAPALIRCLMIWCLLPIWVSRNLGKFLFSSTQPGLKSPRMGAPSYLSAPFKCFRGAKWYIEQPFWFIMFLKESIRLVKSREASVLQGLTEDKVVIGLLWNDTG